MNTRRRWIGAVVFVALAICARSAVAQSVWHDPWLNWDFLNFTGQQANDFAIIVESGTYDPGNQWFGDPFGNLAVTHNDYDGDSDTDTMLKWSGGVVNADTNGVFGDEGDLAHMGLWMGGSGRILDAYWTKDCNKIGPSLAISYELTEIRFGSDPEVHMHLQIAPGYYDDTLNPDYPNAEAGWTNIRTFVSIPADVLALEDLNRDLDLDALAAYEVHPENGETGAPITQDDVIWGQPDSFFDIYLDVIPPEEASPAFESLLHAQVVNQGEVIGQFWNLNPQCPEPATWIIWSLLGGLAAAFGWWRTRHT